VIGVIINRGARPFSGFWLFHTFPLCFFPRRWSSNITSLLHCTLQTLQKYKDIMCRAISELAALLLEPLIRGSYPQQRVVVRAHNPLSYSCSLPVEGYESLSAASLHCFLIPRSLHLPCASTPRNAPVGSAHLLLPPGRRCSSISGMPLVDLLVRLLLSVPRSVNVTWAVQFVCLTHTIRPVLVEKQAKQIWN
jgi:hypothetical protein